MGLRESVLAELTNNYPTTLNNNQLAARLDANEPSVRRVTRELNIDDLIIVRRQDFATGQIEWQKKVAPVQTTLRSSYQSYR